MSDINEVSENHFASIRFRHNLQNKMLLEALDHVRHFIIRNALVLVGGMSIDSALRLKGERLYDDDEIPDYDFYSPRNAEHAYLLGSELCEKKYPTVDVIPAIHTTTMKVRVDGNVVADITYMPLEIFERLRTLEYRGMRTVHPWMVMLDQFRSLSMPYENPPHEVIFERWRKDITRFNMLHKAYPIAEGPKKIPQLTRVKIPKLAPCDALQGWAALAMWEGAEGDVEIPVDYCSVVTTDIQSWIGKSQDVKFYNPLFSYPRHIRARGVEVFDFWGERVTIIEAEIPRVSLPALMYYFLNRWLLRGDELALAGVKRTQAVMLARPREIMSIRPLGDQSWNTSTLYSIAKTVDRERVKMWVPPPQHFETDKRDVVDCRVRKSFDPAQSPLFAIDGSECKRFEPIIASEYLELK